MLLRALRITKKKPQAAWHLSNNSWESQCGLVTLAASWKDHLIHLWGGMAQLLHSSQKCYPKDQGRNDSKHVFHIHLTRLWCNKSSSRQNRCDSLHSHLSSLPFVKKTKKSYTVWSEPQIRKQEKKKPTRKSTLNNSACLAEPVWELSDTSTDSYSTSTFVMAALLRPRNGSVWPCLA